MSAEIVRSVTIFVVILSLVFLVVLGALVFRTLLIVQLSYFREVIEKLRQNRQALRRLVVMTAAQFVATGVLFVVTLTVFPETRELWRIFVVGLLSIIAARVVLLIGELLLHTIRWIKFYR